MRKFKSKQRDYVPDPKFKNTIIPRIVSHIMKNGKRTVAYKIIYEAMDKLKNFNNSNKNNDSPIETLKKALKNVIPHVEVRSVRRGGSNIQVPVNIGSKIKVTKGIKFLIESARKRNEKTMAKKLFLEILSASRGEGAAVKRKENIHKMAEANKAFSHLIY